MGFIGEVEVNAIGMLCQPTGAEVVQVRMIEVSMLAAVRVSLVGQLHTSIVHTRAIINVAIAKRSM